MFFNEDIVYHHKNYEITKLKGNLFANKGKLEIRFIPIISLDLFLWSKSRFYLLFNKIEIISKIPLYNLNLSYFAYDRIWTFIGVS